MTISDARRAALLMEVHRAIEEAASQAAELLARVSAEPNLAYPPNAGLDATARSVLTQAPSRPEAVAAIRKVVAAAAAAPLLHLFALMDGVAEPDDWQGEWPPVDLADATDDDPARPMLHDELFESYWSWVAKRDDVGWRLDSADEPALPDPRCSANAGDGQR